MENQMIKEMEELIIRKVDELERPDLFRTPLVAFSSATDKRYEELKELIGDWHQNPRELLEDAETVVSYFIPFTKAVAKDPKKVAEGSALWGEAYAIINSYFDHINAAVIGYLKDKGFTAGAVPATHTFDPKDMKSMWSHRSAGVIAGLGKFGANRMVITEKGAAGRFCSVMTSAVIPRKDELAEDRCLYNKDGSCGLCFHICPVQALQPDSFNKFACQYVCNTNQKQDKLGADTCGKCISVCPVAYID